MQPDILARKHIARERRIYHPVSHGMIKEVALGPSPGQLHFQDCFHVLRVAPPANCGFSNSWFVKTGYARLFVRSTEINTVVFACIRTKVNSFKLNTWSDYEGMNFRVIFKKM